MKRLWLGLALIAATSSILLISDLNQRRASAGSVPRIAILQHASQVILDDAIRGIMAALSEGGFTEGRTMTVQRFNAENDIATANSIARELVSGKFDLIITATTLSLQTVARANVAGKVKHVFGIVSDPAGAGVGVSRDNPLEHPKYMAGIGTMQPVREVFDLARQSYPALKTVGVAWNPAESNSEANVRLARQVSNELGIKLMEATVENSSGVFEAASSLVSRGVDAIWVGGDLTVVVAIDSVLAAAKRGRIPVFTSIPGNAEKGAIFDLGADYFEVGRQTGSIAAQVLSGVDPATIPVRNVVPEKIPVNTAVLETLKAPWHIPDEVVARAKAASSNIAPLSRKWKLNLIELNNVLDVEEAEAGILDGLKKAGLVEGRDYEVTIRNAQGDMATLNGLVDAAIAERADLLLTLSTPTLQAAIQRAQGRVPIVFTYVASAVKAGAGKSDTDHLPNVTGVPVVGAYDQMLPVLREILPNARRLGTLYVPAEVNMVFNRDELAKTAQKYGMEVISVGVATSSEVPDAALALMGRGIDVLCQISGNLTAASFGGIAQAAQRTRKPVFAFQQAQVREGAAVVLARDYRDAGAEAAALAARVMRGESPGNIPFQPFAKTKLIINLKSAAAVGLHIPTSVLATAADVIKD
jgi:ABC-type uncharacterized transport system substrate-binding protein